MASWAVAKSGCTPATTEAFNILLPLLGAASGAGPLGVLDYLGAALWCVGMIFEAGGDLQVAQILVTPNPDPNVRNLKRDKAQNENEAHQKIERIMNRLKAGDDYVGHSPEIGGWTPDYYLAACMTPPFNICSRSPVLAVPMVSRKVG